MRGMGVAPSRNLPLFFAIMIFFVQNIFKVKDNWLHTVSCVFISDTFLLLPNLHFQHIYDSKRDRLDPNFVWCHIIYHNFLFPKMIPGSQVHGNQLHWSTLQLHIRRILTYFFVMFRLSNSGGCKPDFLYLCS